MNYSKYNTIYCKRCFYFLVYKELSIIGLENQLLIIKNTMNINTILQPSNFNVFLHGYFSQCNYSLFGKRLFWINLMSFQKRYEEMQLYKKPLKISESRSKYYEEIQSNKKKEKT